LTVGGENSALQVLDEAAPWNRSTLGDAAGITPSPAAVRQNHEPASTLRTADQLTLYQTVRMLDARMRPSRLIAGTPKKTAVAATIRSGMSGTSSRGTCRIASTTSTVNGTSSIT